MFRYLIERCHFYTSCLLLVGTLLMSRSGSAKHVNDDRFMSDVNLEHYYVIEENALSNADVLLRDDYFGDDEEEDAADHHHHAPNLTSFKSIINEAKTVHRIAGPDLEAFLAHPINVYHLFRRLDNGWREGLELLLQTKPCKKWNLPLMVGRIRYLLDNLPGKEERSRVIEYMAKLQKIHRISVKDIAEGKLGDAMALKPLTIQEQFEIVKVLHDKEDMRTALDWLYYISEIVEKLNATQRAELGFSQTDILNLMASAYYDIGNVAEALDKTEKALEIDPNNQIAHINRLFFSNKLARQKEENDAGFKKTTFFGKRLPKFERLCSKTKPGRMTKKTCRLVRIGLMFYKLEPVRHKPHIVIVHDVIRNKTADILKSYAHEMQTEQAWISEETFQPPKFAVDLKFDKIEKSSVKKEARRLLDHMYALSTLAEERPEAWEPLQVINIGLEGVHLEQHWPELHLYKPAEKKWRKETGAYFVFLNDVKIGGEVVFTDKNIVLRPEKGSVLFYYHSKVSLHSFCPVIGSSLWVAVQPVRERLRDYCVDADEWL